MTDDSSNPTDTPINETLSASSSNAVKSTAVVKWSAVSTPATFAQLQCNTNLNVPPSNWLSTSAESYGLQNVWSHSHGFSSFRMAHMFPDCVGEVDVVSDAENIKKLLKIPYSRELVSMMVHRVENTLLLDDFDIAKYLFKQAENDWEWLKKIYYKHVFQGDKEKRLYPKVNTRTAAQQKNLMSSFFYHSLVLANDKPYIEEKPTLPVKTLQPLLPEPSQEEKLPDPSYNHNFNRNVVWTFENIQMLIGTDMPIFGSQNHPCISLKLRDASQPINVLTGIDYWLDNLMCNVPEVIMCFHVNGIVQNYELIKTEDLPNVSNAEFNPKAIRDIAANILSFLKNNATQAGHTYWLFKGEDDDLVKLYDLTSLCSDMTEDKSQNPFTVPVAMLLYRVARNMKYSSDYKKNRGTIRMLLKNCIKLLSDEKYPEIVTSAHILLADLYVPADTDPINPNLTDLNDEDDTQSDVGSNWDSDKSDTNLEEDMNAAIKCLTLSEMKEQHYKDAGFEQFKFKPPPISGTVEERCQSALEHVSSGLDCLKYFPSEPESKKSSEVKTDGDKPEKGKHEYDEATNNMAKPFQAIPMPYVPLDSSSTETASAETDALSPSGKKKGKQKKKKTSKKTAVKTTQLEDDVNAKLLLCKAESKTLPTWQAPKDKHSWGIHLKVLLYEKASLTFAVLSENEYSQKNYGSSLRYIVAALRCQKMIESLYSVKNGAMIGYLLGRAGDCFLMVVQNWNDKNHNDYETKTLTEASITDAIFTVQNLDMSEINIFPERFQSLESVLLASQVCYEKALSFDPEAKDRENLLKRLGNIHNELGVLYMNQVSSNFEKIDENVDAREKTLNLSLKHLEAGVKAFDEIHDKANLALLYCNTGHLMRLWAHINSKQPKLERNYFKKAVSNYQKAHVVLGVRKTMPEIWDTVNWDLCTTFFNMATQLQDYPESQVGEEQELADILLKALDTCDTKTPGPRLPVYQFRAATIQHRLASLYHKIYRELDPETDSAKRKNYLQLSKNYYEKAAKLLLALEQTNEFLTVQMERVALSEFQASKSTGYISTLKAYQSCLELILQSKLIIDIIIERNKSITSIKENKNITEGENQNSETKESDDKEKEEKNLEEKNLIEDELILVTLLKERLLFVLLSLTKLCNSKSKDQKKDCENYNLYKNCYSLALKTDDSPGTDLMTQISGILNNIEKTLHTQHT